MRIRKNIALAVVICITVPAVVSGCVNNAKKGTEALESGDYKEAQAQFEELTKNEDSKKAAEGYRGLGMAYYEQEDYAAALDAFQKAVDGGVVQTTQIYNLMGICAMHTEDYGAALEYIHAGLAMADTTSSYRKDSEKKEPPEDEGDSADMIREMRFNEIVCYEKLADWENAKQKAGEYMIDYPNDETMEQEAEFLGTR